jgi:hypothetical protein
MKQTSSILTGLSEPFTTNTRIDVRPVAVFLVINGLVFVNACLHDPTIGYDNRSFFNYIETLSNLRLVTSHDSREFFSPPLPFALPALLMATSGMDIVPAVKVGQFLNVGLSLGLTWYLLKVCGLFSP